ncbi:MAG: hypothetical protein ACRCYY_04955 [Trueperaceae bacterium]
MVLVGAVGFVCSLYAFWLIAQLKTVWLQQVVVVCCGFGFASALLCMGYGFYYGNILRPETFDIPMWIPK